MADLGSIPSQGTRSHMLQLRPGTAETEMFTTPGGSGGKVSACSGVDPGSISGLGRYPGEGNGYPFQYSCLENSMDRGAWRATVHGVTKS